MVDYRVVLIRLEAMRTQVGELHFVHNVFYKCTVYFRNVQLHAKFYSFADPTN